MTVPRPLAAPGEVTVDARERELVVRPARDAGSAYARVLWREGVRGQAASSGPYGPPAVWANGAGQRQIAQGLPGGDGTMRFRFPVGDPNYRKLVSTPGLRAIVVVDRGTPGRILGVAFRGR